MQEQLLERGGDRVPLLSAERFEECLVGGDQFMKRLPGDLAASALVRNSAHAHRSPTPVQPPGQLAALRARVAELEVQLAGRDAQLAAAQARLVLCRLG